MTHHKIIIGDCLEVLREMPSESVNMVITSPPYWGLRTYGEGAATIWGGDPSCEHEWIEERMTLVHENHNFQKGTQEAVHGKKGTTYIKKFDDKTSGFCQKCGAWRGQLGLEPTWQMYVEHLVEISQELKRVLRKDGSYYLNLGDTYAGSGCGSHDYRDDTSTGILRKRRREIYQKSFVPQQKQRDSVTIPKQKLLMPHRAAIALQEDGWICRNDITWYKPNAMPSSVKDRLTCKTEPIFHLVKSRKYYYDLDAIREPHKTGTPQANRDLKRMMAGRTQYGGKWAEGKGTQAAFVAGHPLGKNPGDVVLTKHDIAVRRFPRVNRKGGVGYTDPLHVKPYHAKGKNPGDFWEINTRPYPDAHFAVYPEEICIKPILSSCPPNGIVLDPFMGRGTTIKVARDNGRNSVGIEIQPSYLPIIKKYLEIDQQQQRLGVTYEIITGR